MSLSIRFIKLDTLFASTLLLSPLITGYTYALVFPPAHQTSRIQLPKYFHADTSWTIRETFSIDVYILNVESVSAWQVKLVYDPYLVVPLNVAAGDFFSLKTLVINSSWHLEQIDLDEEEIFDYAILCFATDVGPGVLLLGGFRFDTQSLSNSGKVATITFGVWSHADGNYNVYVQDILLLNTNLTETKEGTIAINN